MKTNINESLEILKTLNESRYYYGEIEHIRDGLSQTVEELTNISDTLRENLDLKDNEYSKSQIEKIRESLTTIKTCGDTLFNLCNELSEIFPNNIGSFVRDKDGNIIGISDNKGNIQHVDLTDEEHAVLKN